jgi:TLD
VPQSVPVVRTLPLPEDVNHRARKQDNALYSAVRKYKAELARAKSGLFPVFKSGLREKIKPDIPAATSKLCQQRQSYTKLDVADSTVLAVVPFERFVDFCDKLSQQWLPGIRMRLLYRGSRDGMTALAFHGLCDNKGPSVVLVRSGNSVFGGYAGRAWRSESATLPSRESFVFIVQNPHKDNVTMIPLRHPDVRDVLGCSGEWGPVFFGGFAVKGPSADTPFDDWESCCYLTKDGAFGDPLGRGDATLTGSLNFLPSEIEVFVCV